MDSAVRSSKQEINMNATFADRKKARIAAGAVAYKFVVVAPWNFSNEIVGSFDSRSAAETFAFKQLSGLAGDTSAMRAVFAAHSKTSAVPTSLVFSVQRLAA